MTDSAGSTMTLSALTPPHSVTPHLSRVSSLPASASSTPPEGRPSPPFALSRPHSSLPGITPLPDPTQSLDIAYTKLLNALRTRTTSDYCKAVLHCTEAAYAALTRATRQAEGKAVPAVNGQHSHDILDFCRRAVHPA